STGCAGPRAPGARADLARSSARIFRRRPSNPKRPFRNGNDHTPSRRGEAALVIALGGAFHRKYRVAGQDRARPRASESLDAERRAGGAVRSRARRPARTGDQTPDGYEQAAQVQAPLARLSPHPCASRTASLATGRRTVHFLGQGGPSL